MRISAFVALIVVVATGCSAPVGSASPSAVATSVAGPSAAAARPTGPSAAVSPLPAVAKRARALELGPSQHRTIGDGTVDERSWCVRPT
jgi:hypothetical protein